MSVLMAILGLGILIFLHELGHLLAAKATGLPVIRFSIGMGPVIFSRTHQGIEYAVSILPFGGYVMFDGESEDFERAEPWKRIVTALAGPAANLLVGVLLYVAAVSVTQGGFALIPGLEKTGQALQQLFNTLYMLFSGQVGIKDLGGPVMMVSAGASMAHDPSAFMSYLGFLSLNLAIFNLLPIPALDGGQILLLVATQLLGRQPSERMQMAMMGGSFVLMMGLIAIVTLQDFSRLL